MGEPFFRPMSLGQKADWLVSVLADGAIKRACESRATGDGVSHTAVKTVAATIAIAIHNSKDGRCFPKFETIGEKCGIHKNMVRRAVEVLRSCGWLETMQHSGMRTSLRYRLTYPSSSTVHGTTCSTSCGATAAPPTVQRDTPDGVTAAPRTVSEPMKINPGRQAGEEIQVITDLRAPALPARPTASGAVAPSSPAGNEYLAGQEGEPAGLRTNSAAPAPVGSAFDLPPGMNPPGMSHLARRPGESETDYRLRVNSAVAYPSRDPMITPSALLVSWDDQDDDRERRLLAMVQPAS